ncbi:MAG: DEAD/DEAH box helicase [Deltaproteobacteria bacterium]|nr:DEAD/DEAH box helicase [Deltaproteobacteria bacterium]
MTSAADLELEYFEKFFFTPGLEPYPVQEQAASHIFAGRSVLVTVPTGTGKTLMAKAGLLKALRSGQRAIYTTPLRALTEEKYRELCVDFGEENVGFATGDYRVNPEAPIQVLVAEILWNRIFTEHQKAPAEVVVMDEGHYFNDWERGYVWEQSIIGLHPDCQLVILSATIGYPQAFCQWVNITRQVPMELVVSHERKVPLYHEFREQYLIEVVKELYQAGDYPALVFSFGRALCFERARLLRSCPRFTTKEEQAEIEKRAERVVLPRGIGPDFLKLLGHGIGVHHAGILPAYRRLVEELTAERLLKFVVTTETIAAGINLPAKRTVFPSLKKVIKKQARLLLPAEYHQMAGRAGRPQFDTEGIALTLAPEEVVQEFRKELKDLAKGKMTLKVDESKIKQKYYNRAKTEARAKEDVTWDAEVHKKLVEGQPATLVSRTKITAEQVLAIGLPDLSVEVLPGQAILEKEAAKAAVAEGVVEEDRPAVPEGPVTDLSAPKDDAKARRLNIRTVIDHLLLPDHLKWEAHKRLAQITRNLQALGVLDATGRQIDGEIIGQIRGLDGPFVWYALKDRELDEPLLLEFLELVVDHDVIHREMDKKDSAKRKVWILERLRERRRENSLISFEDVEAEYFELFPRELTPSEQVLQAFLSKVPHPELHGGKLQKKVWAQMEQENLTFMDFVEANDLAQEEGSLFTYLARLMKAARSLHEVTGRGELAVIEKKIRERLAAIDERVLEGLW